MTESWINYLYMSFKNPKWHTEDLTFTGQLPNIFLAKSLDFEVQFECGGIVYQSNTSLENQNN